VTLNVYNFSEVKGKSRYINRIDFFELFISIKTKTHFYGALNFMKQ